MTRSSGLRGAAAVEVLLALTLLLAPLSVAAFELLQLAVSRQLLQVALFDGVRAAATARGDMELLRRVVARGLLPLHGAPATSRGDRAAALQAYGRALAEVSRPDLTRIDIRSPSRRDFDVHGFDLDGDRRIPNEGAERVAANVLDVRVVHCRALVVPAADLLFRAALGAFASADMARCLAQGRMPIAAQATTLMQSDASARAMGVSLR